MAEPIWLAMGLALLAGFSIPVCALRAVQRFGILPGWAESEARHGVIAFGAGALLAAVALVLVPHGSERLAMGGTLFWLMAGAVIFAAADWALARRGGRAAQFLAMMMDYLPEAMALGALVTGDFGAAVLVAILIALQNVPESFNGMREMTHDRSRGYRHLLLLVVPLGPMAAAAGLALDPLSPVIGAVMMLDSGGILFLMFQDIASQVPLKATWLPPFGAVLGVLSGLARHMVI
jgi:ZIP family zinc transporter